MFGITCTPLVKLAIQFHSTFWPVVQHLRTQKIIKVACLNTSTNMSLQSSTLSANRRIHKLLKLHAPLINLKANVSTARKTHYDTLDVQPTATSNEIKSAYYKLTLKYHPDKNKSESAKQRFQEVANAYEVLGNYKSRKQYDRSIAIRYKDINQLQRPQETYAQSTPERMYNFDEWTRAHYQSTFERTQSRRNAYKAFVNKRNADLKSAKSESITGYIMIALSLSYVIIMYNWTNNNDIPSNSKQD